MRNANTPRTLAAILDPMDDRGARTVESLEEELAGLRAAMRTRAVIEQAKGILMSRQGCSPEQAFQLLVTLSQRRHAKLRDVAEALVAACGGVSLPRSASWLR